MVKCAIWCAADWCMGAPGHQADPGGAADAAEARWRDRQPVGKPLTTRSAGVSVIASRPRRGWNALRSHDTVLIIGQCRRLRVEHRQASAPNFAMAGRSGDDEGRRQAGYPRLLSMVDRKAKQTEFRTLNQRSRRTFEDVSSTASVPPASYQIESLTGPLSNALTCVRPSAHVIPDASRPSRDPPSARWGVVAVVPTGFRLG